MMDYLATLDPTQLNDLFLSVLLALYMIILAVLPKETHNEPSN